MSKRYQTKVSNHPKSTEFGDLKVPIWHNVKKVPNGRVQGLDPGEMLFEILRFG
jgi:hypothetical protein